MKIQTSGSILVVGDEIELANTICEMLEQQGYETVNFSNGKDALTALKEKEFDVLLTDLMLPDMDGIELLKKSLEIDRQIVGIIMTGHGTIQTAVEAMKTGSFDFILKPFKSDALLHTISKAMEVNNLKKENIELRGSLAVYELTKAATFSVNKDIVVDRVAEAALAQCQADEVSVMLPTDQGDELYVAAVRGNNRDHIIGKKVKVGQGIAGWVAKHHEFVSLNGNVDDSRFAPVCPRNEIKNAVSVPMMAGGKFVGVININLLSDRTFTADQINRLNITISMAGPSLKNAWLFEQMQKTEQKYRMLFENAVEGIFQATPDRRFIIANPSMAKMLGYKSPEDLTESVTDIGRQMFVSYERYVEFKNTLEKSGRIKGFETEFYQKNKNVIWVSINAFLVRDKKGFPSHCEGTVEDISSRKRMEEMLLNAANEWRTTFDAISDIVWLMDNDLKIIRCNVSTARFLNKPFSEIIGRPCYELMHGTSEPIKNCPYQRTRVTCKKETSVLQINDRWFNISTDPIFDGSDNIRRTVHALSDITNEKRAEEELRELSLKDYLTGLLNRRGFFALAEQQLKVTRRMRQGIVLVFADMDDLKLINDNLGHKVGDKALKETAQVLVETFRESDIVARIGGDEFAILAMDNSRERVDAVIARLYRNLKNRNSMPGRNYNLSLSIGTAHYDFGNPCSVKEFLAQADKSMYEDKQKKKNLKT